MNIVPLLARWGRWSVRRATAGLGWPSSSPSCRDYRSSDVHHTAYDPDYTPADLLACDAAVTSLPPVLRIVVVTYYQHGGSMREAARRAGISAHAMSRYLDDAHKKIVQAIDNVEFRAHHPT